MAQVTLYLPDEVASKIKRAAKRSGQSLSAYVTGLAKREVDPARWPTSFQKLYGSWEGDFDIPEPPPLDDIVLP